MSNRKYSLEDVVDIVNSEGLEYALDSYLDIDSVEDVTFAKLCQDAKQSIDAVENYLDENCGDWRF